MAVDNARSRPDDGDADWPLASVSWPTFNPATVVLRYDDETDTLFVHLHGRSLPAVSVPLDVTDPHGVGYLYLELSLDAPTVVGVFVEDFLARAVPMHPEWGMLLATANDAHHDDAVVQLVDDVRGLWRHSLHGLVTHQAS